MAEPSVPSILITGAIATVLGPVLGPAALIIFGAVAGSLLAMGKASTETRGEAIKFVAVGVFIALAMTSLVAWLLERYFDIPANAALMPVAAVIAAARTALLTLMDKVVDGFTAVLAVVPRRGGDKHD